LLAATAIATMLAAFSARTTATKTKDIVLADIIMRIRERFAKIEIPKEIKERQALGFNHWEKFADEEELSDHMDEPAHQYYYNWIIDYYQIFSDIMILYDSNIINKKLINRLASDDDLNLYFGIIKPLELKLNLLNDHTAFDRYLRLINK